MSFELALLYLVTFLSLQENPDFDSTIRNFLKPMSAILQSNGDPIRDCDEFHILRDDVDKDNDGFHTADSAFEQFGKVIVPGTYWCGPGNMAPNETAVHPGPMSGVDACCRAHDRCDHFINGQSAAFNLTNQSYFTRLACDCENIFVECLRKASHGSVVGTIYYNIYAPQCFQLDFRKKCCARRDSLLQYLGQKRCSRYEYYEDSEKTYQWFDIAPFPK